MNVQKVYITKLKNGRMEMIKKNTKLYAIYYIGDENNPRTLEAITDNFEKWLEEHNAQRIEEGNDKEDADEFEVKPISLSLYEENGDD